MAPIWGLTLGAAMDLIQVTAYPMMDQLMVQVTTCTAVENGRKWEHRIMERLAVPGDAGDPWDAIWALGQLLCDRALQYGAETRHGAG